MNLLQLPIQPALDIATAVALIGSAGTFIWNINNQNNIDRNNVKKLAIDNTLKRIRERIDHFDDRIRSCAIELSKNYDRVTKMKEKYSSEEDKSKHAIISLEVDFEVTLMSLFGETTFTLDSLPYIIEQDFQQLENIVDINNILKIKSIENSFNMLKLDIKDCKNNLEKMILGYFNLTLKNNEVNDDFRAKLLGTIINFLTNPDIDNFQQNSIKGPFGILNHFYSSVQKDLLSLVFKDS